MPLLEYSYIESTTPIGVPPRQVNGGLYTGVPANGPWGNIPIEPETHTFIDTHYQKGFDKPPPDMKYQAISTIRPGNNNVKHPYHKMCTGLQFNRLCADK